MEMIELPDSWQLQAARGLFSSFVGMFYGDEDLEFRVYLVTPKMRSSRVSEKVPVVFLVTRDQDGKLEKLFPLAEIIALPFESAKQVYEPFDTSEYTTTIVHPKKAPPERTNQSTPNSFLAPSSKKIH